MMSTTFKGILKQKINWLFIYVGIIAVGTSYVGETTALFTDSSPATDNVLQGATLDISVTPATDIYNITNMLPGDSAERTITVDNNGNADFTYRIQNSGTETILWTDTTNGLQLTIKEGTTIYYDGSISELNSNTAAEFLLPVGTSDTLTFIVSLPTSADNSFQGISEMITFTFDATQVAGSTR
jgi:spore coat-associated protein N